MDVAPGGIDAATIKISNGPVGSRFYALNAVAPWTDVELFSRTTTKIGKVTSVTDMRGSLSPNMPGRVFVDIYGQSGDSGAALLETSGAKRLVGIYMGTVTNPSGSTEGLCQHAAQVMSVLKVRMPPRRSQWVVLGI